MAAWLGVREAGGVVSHESTLELYELSDVIPDAVHLSLPRSKRGTRPRDGVRLHTTDHPADSSEIRQIAGVPVTSPERTIVDALDAGTQPEQIEMALHQALDRGLSSPSRIRAATERRSPRAKHFIARVLDESLQAIGVNQTRGRRDHRPFKRERSPDHAYTTRRDVPQRACADHGYSVISGAAVQNVS
jgi:predicted transcriptional regulator of viral defense system